MEQKTRKKPSLTGKIKRLITGKKAVNPHKRYPERYFAQIWHTREAVKCINAVAHLEKITKQKSANQLIVWGWQYYWMKKLEKEQEARNNPTDEALQADRTRYYLRLRQLCRQMGWDINKLLPNVQVKRKI